MTTPLFDKVALIGIGLIGSSLARVIRREKLAGHIAIATRSADTLARAEELKLGDSYSTGLAEAVRDADLVIVHDDQRETPLPGGYEHFVDHKAQSGPSGAVPCS